MQPSLHWWTVNPEHRAESILFIHGGPGSHSQYFKQWVLQHERFTRNYGWVSYDQRGCGYSESADQYSHARNVDDCLSMLDRLATEGVVITAIAAHSYGAKLIYDVLQVNPGIDQSIVLLGRSLRADIPAKRNFMIDMILLKLFQTEDYKSLTLTADYDVNDPASLWDIKQKLRETLTNRDIRGLFNWHNLAAMDKLENIRAQCSVSDNDDVFKAVVGSIHQKAAIVPDYDFGGLRQRVLHIMGSSDFVMAGDLFVPEDRHNYRSRVFSHSGHYPHFEEPDRFIETVEAFLLSPDAD
ncbi:alpha/beta fold hydrolase [Hahella ganghwensis]|uniref:alpha/beta fold hydrolase n=1 Tax=Hahella ganghwensis TaxID=286420 RepID=UPI00035CD2E4|nr:alpha/beta hydrolase [Hahella ganghwensis]